jgi:hypothetical protein
MTTLPEESLHDVSGGKTPQPVQEDDGCDLNRPASAVGEAG